MKKTKKIISLLLSILMIITALALTAVESFAADEITSGVTGDCTWSLDSDGVLTISGNGKMKIIALMKENRGELRLQRL